MTLIFSNMDAEAGLLVGSDILLSRPAVSGPAPVNLPFRDEPLLHESQGRTFGRFAQKLVTFGRTMVQWAGSEAVARAAITEIRKVSNDGEEQIDLHSVLRGAGMLDSELNQVGIIYHFNAGPETVVRNAHHCDTLIEHGTAKLIADGSGAQQFFHEILVRGGDRLGRYAFPAGLMGKIVTHSLYEWGGETSTLDHLYGGWFELAHKGPDGFRKIPYAIKLWRRSGGIMESGGPIFFGFYADERLSVLTLQPHEVDGQLRHGQRLTLVPDLFGRGHAAGPPNGTFRPDFVAHIILEDQSHWHITYVEADTAFPDVMVLEASGAGCRVAYPPGLRTRLLAQKAGDTDFSIDSNFSSPN